MSPHPAEPRRAARRELVVDILILALGLIGAYFLKRHYSSADASDLAWILRPTVAMVSWITDVSFVDEAAQGYVSAARRYIVAPSCAGVNFLIIAGASLVAGNLHRMRGTLQKGALVISSLMVAYMATLIANTTRIVVSLETQHLMGFASPDGHRLQGTLIYVVALLLLCATFPILRRVLSRERQHPPC